MWSTILKSPLHYQNGRLSYSGGYWFASFLVLGFSVYKVSQISNLEQTAYGQGEEKAVAHFRAFFEASPKASELYQEWREPKSKK